MTTDTRKSDNNRPAVILANGASLDGLNLQTTLTGLDAFGMGVACRHWESIGWYPAYYACLDEQEGLSLKEDIAKLINRAEEFGIRRFLLRNNLVTQLGQIGQSSLVLNMDDMRERGKAFLQNSAPPGSSTVLGWALDMGYEDIILLGVDQPDPAPAPDSPNGWAFAALLAEGNGAMVVTANPKSQLTTFPRLSLPAAKVFLQDNRQNRTPSKQAPGLVGICEREQDCHIDETRVIKPFLPSQGLMLDVGAKHGGSLLPLLRRGWDIHAFEPDPANRAILDTLPRGNGTLTLDSRAVSEVSGREVAWISAPDVPPQEDAAHGRSPHTHTDRVHTVTLRDFCLEKNIQEVDFLRIDAEGFDFMVLRGFPFESIKPLCILCGFEDRATSGLGYTVHDMAYFLLWNGYHVYISEWHPTLRQGVRHQWRRFIRFPSGPLPDAKGNIVAFLDPPDEKTLAAALSFQLKLYAKKFRPVPHDNGTGRKSMPA